MPEIYLYGDRRMFPKEIAEIEEAFRHLPCHGADAVFVPTNTVSTGTNGESKPFIRIEASTDVSNADFVEIGNHFLKKIDVSIRTGNGFMDFREKGQEFDISRFPKESQGGTTVRYPPGFEPLLGNKQD